MSLEHLATTIDTSMSQRHAAVLAYLEYLRGREPAASLALGWNPRWVLELPEDCPDT
jgi:hypothetical protein